MRLRPFLNHATLAWVTRTDGGPGGGPNSPRDIQRDPPAQEILHPLWQTSCRRVFQQQHLVQNAMRHHRGDINPLHNDQIFVSMDPHYKCVRWRGTYLSIAYEGLKYHHRGTLLPSITRGGLLLLVTTFYKLRRFTIAFTTSCVSSTKTPKKSSWHLFCPVPLAYFHFKSPCPVSLYGPIASIWGMPCHDSLWRHCTWCSCRPGGHVPTLSWGSSDLRALTASDRLGPSGFASVTQCCTNTLNDIISFPSCQISSLNVGNLLFFGLIFVLSALPSADQFNTNKLRPFLHSYYMCLVKTVDVM